MAYVLSAMLLFPAVQILAQDYWEQAGQMPSARLLCSTETVDSTIYLIGGLNSSAIATVNVYAYNPADRTFETREPLPEPLAASATAVVNGKIYLFGGIKASQGVVSQSCYVYDPETNHWAILANMPPVPRGYAVAEAVDNKIYVIGGFGSGSAPAIKQVQVYDPQQNTWATLSNMPTARGYMASAVLNGKIYVMGGGEAAPSYASLATVEVYDPLSDTWSTAPDLPTPRWGPAAGVLNNTIYVAGGVISPSFLDLDVVEGFSEESGWQTFAPLPTPIHGMGVGIYEDSLYAFGGLSGTVVKKDVFLYHSGNVGVSDASAPAPVLMQNAPNPFRDVTSITVDLPVAARVELSVYDLTGKLIRVIAAENLSAGQHTYRFEANSLPKGVYFYRIWIDGSYQCTRKMLVSDML